MRKSLLPLGIAAAFVPAPLLAQATPNTGADYTNNVRSQSIGTTGQSANAVDQYLQRKGLQDLPGGQASAKSGAKVGRSRPAKPDELTAGAIVNDKTGVVIAKIESADRDGIVVSTATGKIKVPAEAFGHNKAGLLIDMTKAQFEQIVAQANTAH